MALLGRLQHFYTWELYPGTAGKALTPAAAAGRAPGPADPRRRWPRQPAPPPTPRVLPQSTGGGAPGRKRKGGGFGVVGGAAGEGGGCEVVTPKGGGTPHQLRSVEAGWGGGTHGGPAGAVAGTEARGGGGRRGRTDGASPPNGLSEGRVEGTVLVGASGWALIFDRAAKPKL